VNPRVAEVLLARGHKACLELGRELGREIEVRGQPGLHQEQFEVTALDSGPPVSIPLQWLGFPPETGDERASTAELQIEADGPSGAAAPDDTTGSADTAADEPAPTPPRLEASREAAEQEMGESVTALELAAADEPEPAPPEPAPAVASSEQASRESTPAEASSEQASRESTPVEADLEAAPPEDGSTAEPVIAASAEATESEKRFEAPAPAAEMLDLEPKTPILPHPAEVEEK
jgi:hypothetical protein